MRSLSPTFIFFLLLSGVFTASGQAAPPEKTNISIPGSDQSFEMVFLKGGVLTISEGDREGEVRLSPFWIGTREVTHDEYRLFQFRVNDTDESGWKEGQFAADAVARPTPPYLDLTYGMGTRGGFPEVNMTQQAALRYCQWLYQKTGIFFRLPTEAEWEFACRAGGDGQVDPIGDVAWYYDNGEERYHVVGQKKPNGWGLYDMLGNVAEWTLDQYKPDYLDAAGPDAENPWIKPEGKHARTVKGGSYDTFAADCNCSARVKSSAKWQARDPQIPKSIWWNVDAPFVGFRLVRPAAQPAPAEVEAFFKEAIKD